jgi:anti-sigma regulatory factor (Ser/Thr protein kinase)
VANPGNAESEILISTEAADFTRFYAWLAEALAGREIAEGVLYKLHVAAEEAIMNVAKHAYLPGAFGEFSVRLSLSPEQAVLRIEDAGRPFDPVTAPMPNRPASLEDAKPGGLGITLMRQYCPDITYERAQGRNRLTLRFPLELS